VQAEIVAAETDLAEVIGGAIAPHLILAGSVNIAMLLLAAVWR
jgi:Mn2+/Fe2+ NRAMP family transporter